MYQFLFILLGLVLCNSQELTASIRLVQDATVMVELTNTASYSVALLRWNLPLDERFESDSFRVLYQGQPVNYIGSRVKYAGPYIDDYIFFSPNETKVYTVRLENAYDFSQPGEYDVIFVADVLDYESDDTFHTLPKTKGLFTPLSGVLSNALQLTTTNKLYQKILRAPYECDSSETSTINTAYSSKLQMIRYAVDRITQGGSTAQYREWFGAANNQRFEQARRIIDTVQRNTVIAAMCDTMANVYAYVYPTDTSHTVYYCDAFWRAPNAGGYDTRAGTIIHELSHFNNIGGTNDWVYGTTAARNLANTNPARAVANADNYEYFCESEW
jgi:peptidyl-Lys metalloendopeptidase